MNLEDASFAIIPAKALPLLAPLRTISGVTVCLDGARSKVAWPAGQRAVLERLLAAPGVELYARHDGSWHRAGRALPDFDLDTGGVFVPLAQALTPAPLDCAKPREVVPRPVPLTLAPGNEPLLCGGVRPDSALPLGRDGFHGHDREFSSGHAGISRAGDGTQSALD